MRKLISLLLVVGACKSTPPAPSAPAAPAAAPCPACPAAAACPPAAECPTLAAAEPQKCPECPQVAAAAPAAVAPTEPVPAADATPIGGKAAHLAMLDELPDNVTGLVTLRLEPILKALSEGRIGFFPSTVDKATFRASLAAASRKEFGVDVFGAKTAFVWASFEGEVAGIVLEGEFGGELAVAGLEKTDLGGKQVYQLDKELYLGQVGSRIILGTPGAFDVKTDPAVTQNRGHHKAALAGLPDGYLFSTVTPGPILAAMGNAEMLATFAGTHAIGSAFSSDIALHVAVSGEAETLARFEALVEQMRKPLIEQMRLGRAELAGKFPGAEIAGVMYDAAVADFEAFKWTQRPSPNLLLGATPSVEIGNAALLIVPVLAVVAVPAYIKYMRRAKTTEAIDYIDKLYKASASYYSSPRVEKGTGRKLPCAFPPSSEATPPIGISCCGGEGDVDGDDRCDVKLSLWDTETWTALNFAITDQHYFHYAYASSGEGPGAKFTASAYADLDCDGVFSTFERIGYGDETGSSAECSMKGSSAFYKNQETE